jgi:hypothetical protein
LESTFYHNFYFYYVTMRDLANCRGFGGLREPPSTTYYYYYYYYYYKRETTKISETTTETE